MANSPRLYVNINGAISPASEARISPLDHGFLYGDSVYETVRTFFGRPFLLGRHLDRLQRSLDRVFLSLPSSRKDFETEILRTIDEVPIDGDVGVRIVVSRGEGPIGLDITSCRSPNVLIYVFELDPSIRPAFAPLGEGVGVVISKTRRNSPRALDPSIKSGNFLNNIFAYKDARDAGAHEAILCNSEGYIAEGTTSNVFVVKDGFVWSPHNYGILDGITRAVVFEEAEKAGIPTGETNIPPEALFSADEIFITSSIKGLVPVTQVNGKPVGKAPGASNGASGSNGSGRKQRVDAATRRALRCAGRDGVPAGLEEDGIEAAERQLRTTGRNPSELQTGSAGLRAGRLDRETPGKGTVPISGPTVSSLPAETSPQRALATAPAAVPAFRSYSSSSSSSFSMLEETSWLRTQSSQVIPSRSGRPSRASSRTRTRDDDEDEQKAAQAPFRGLPEATGSALCRWSLTSRRSARVAPGRTRAGRSRLRRPGASSPAGASCADRTSTRAMWSERSC